VEKLVHDLQFLKRAFLLYVPDVEYTVRIASDNALKLKKLLSLLDVLTNTLVKIRTDRQTTIEALGRKSLDETLRYLMEKLRLKFEKTLSISPDISVDYVNVIKSDPEGYIIDADIRFKAKTFWKDRVITVLYPIYIVDGYIKDPEVLYYEQKRYSIPLFRELLNTGFIQPTESRQPGFTFANEPGGASLYSEAPVGEQEHTYPVNHIWDPFQWK